MSSIAARTYLTPEEYIASERLETDNTPQTIRNV